MSYPEAGARYTHRPKFLERAMAEEKRAAGGTVNSDGGAGDRDALAADEGSGYQSHYSGETHSASPSRMTEEMGSAPFRGRREDTEISTDTDFGNAHDVKTVADRMNQIKPQYLEYGSHREDRRRNGGRIKHKSDGGEVGPSFAGKPAVPMPTIKGVDTGDRMDVDTSANGSSFLRGKKPLKRGGTAC